MVSLNHTVIQDEARKLSGDPRPWFIIVSMPTPASILKDTFGYNQFRPYQREVIENVLNHRDTLAVMPTGGGKSLCYQIPAMLQEGLTVVVSPLIALMKDQVEQARACGIPALFLNSSLTPEMYSENMDAVRSGETKLLYVAPETLLTQRLFSLLDSLHVDLLTIDEAHCISEWGHDFRPEYRQLVNVRQRYPKATCLALTATATSRVRSDIKTSLGFSRSENGRSVNEPSNEFIASFNRENLYIEVIPKTDAIQQVLRFLGSHTDQPGIIYCFSRKQVDQLAADLVKKGYSARPYHAGLDDAVRKANQEAFLRDDAQIIVATIAFGMGINKSNVRFVIHHDLPKSIEGYYQEIGRAGRDGVPAHCLLLYGYGDAAKQRYFIDQKQGNERRVAEQHLEAMIAFAEDDTTCRRKTLLSYFGEGFPQAGQPVKCGSCDNCTAPPPVFSNITIPAQKFLSCVKRTGEQHAAKHVIDVLLGSKDEKVIQAGHDKLSTYGIGMEWNQKQWLHLASQLIQMGYLGEDEDHALSLTPKALDALYKRKPILGQMGTPEHPAQRKPVQEHPGQGSFSQKSVSKEPLPKEHARIGRTLSEHTLLDRLLNDRAEPAMKAAAQPQQNNALYALLRQKRKEIADAANVPPYVIFSDRTLLEMAILYPQSKESLLDIHGVGQVKLQRYGDDFLEVIRDYCKKHKLKGKSTR